MNKKYHHKGISFDSSAELWEKAYQLGRGSGSGSMGRLSKYKAQFINDLIDRYEVESLIDFGCGDGSQNELIEVRNYIGLDVSPTVLRKNIQKHRDNEAFSFFLYDPSTFVDRRGLFKTDMTLSLDVVFHLIEDEIYQAYMHQLFECSKNLVVLYSHDRSEIETIRSSSEHVKFRDVRKWVRENIEDATLAHFQENPFRDCDDGAPTSQCCFFVFQINTR